MARFFPRGEFYCRFDLGPYSVRGARAIGDDCFGLHFGERYDQTNVGPLIDVALISPTIPVVIENAVRYLQIQNEAGKESVAASKFPSVMETIGRELTGVDSRRRAVSAEPPETCPG